MDVVFLCQGRPSKSHSLTVSRSHGLTFIDHFLTVKSKVYLVQKTVAYLRNSSDFLDSNANVIDGLCEDLIAVQFTKKLVW